MDGDARISPYLSGNFAPVRSEDDFVLEVKGEIPRELRGALFRNGPNPQFEPRDPNYHWFTGDGMFHGFWVEDGKVRYANRWVRTHKWNIEHAAGRSLFGTFGNPMTTDPEYFGQDSGVANTAIIWHGGRLLALEEAHPPTAMDPKTLATLGYHDLGGKVTAHPKIDPVTGEMIFFGYNDAPMPFTTKVSYGVANKDGSLQRRETFDAPYSSMIHDFMVTRNHVLFPILPLSGSLERAMSGKPPFAWEPEKPALVGVMRRDEDTSKIRWFSTDACYVFHVMNSWEEGQKIICDVMKYRVAPLFPNADGSRGEQCGAYLVRWTFDLADSSDTIREEPLDDLAGEFPRYDERFGMAANRHGWFAGQSGKPGDVRTDMLAHIDLATGKRTDWFTGKGDALSEPVFVERSADAPEGDGWIVAVAYRAAEDTSEFLVFEAQDVAAGPIATAKMPRRVPFGFHGAWVNGV
ncbi:MAG TPA: carotenoid oxygenase family protein [Caulobacter sp.]|nr:carotenoid oxygenase family protein [Caulobacter sp.]